MGWGGVGGMGRGDSWRWGVVGFLGVVCRTGFGNFHHLGAVSAWQDSASKELYV